MSFLTLLVGCATQSVTASSEGGSMAQASTSQENDVSETVDADNMVSVPKEKGELLEKYDMLLNLMEADDYQSAEAYVHNLLIQQKKDTAGEIEEYLVTVDLNSENFEDYFEFVSVPRYNAFGELINAFGIGLKSKKYDEGLIIYTIDDITVEYTDDYWTDSSSLGNLLMFGSATSGFNVDKLAYTRITDGKVTYIKREYVDSYDIPEFEKPNDYNVETRVELQNGESIYRTLYPEYPY